ncbi:MAG: hypothetical protein A2V88_08955 [Elusimicrobia bacterium RBG_16_66_12]|nr:MAG: hypothetical protein A2V88_08955 [Elusimicrobia bacterium RBG_16_66_12]
MKQPTAVHVSWLKRSDGEGGGVEKFAAYLKQALTEKGWSVAVVSWSDMPQHERYDRQDLPNPDKALLLGTWLDGPAFGVAYDVAVSDGYWGLGITSHPVMPVVHGTWAEMHARMGMRFGLEVQRQGEAFNAPNAYPVACSAASARELRRHHGRAATATIYHGIDLCAFHPRDEALPGPPWIILQAAGKNAKKGAKLLRPIADMLGPDYQIEYLNASIGEEAEAFRRGHVFLHPTYHEGNAYACLEAMATGLPVVTTAAGVFEDIPYSQPKRGSQTRVGFTLPVGSRAEDFALAVRLACCERTALGAGARRWAEQHANMTDFADSWDRLLREIVGEER